MPQLHTARWGLASAFIHVFGFFSAFFKPKGFKDGSGQKNQTRVQPSRGYTKDKQRLGTQNNKILAHRMTNSNKQNKKQNKLKVRTKYNIKILAHRITKKMRSKKRKKGGKCAHSNISRGINSSFLVVKMEKVTVTFTSRYLPAGYPEYELRPGGADVAVDRRNVGDYICGVVDASIGAGIASQVAAFRDGFQEVRGPGGLLGFEGWKAPRGAGARALFWGGGGEGLFFFGGGGGGGGFQCGGRGAQRPRRRVPSTHSDLL